MLASDFDPARRGFLTEVPGHPGALALIPPPPPDRLPVEAVLDALSEADRALGALQAASARWPDPDGFVHLLAAREAVAGIGRPVTLLGLLRALEEENEAASGPTAAALAILTAWDAGRVAVERHGARALDTDLLADLGGWFRPGRGTAGWRERAIWLAPDGSTPDRGGRAACPIDQARYVPPPPDYLPLCLMVLQRLLKPGGEGGGAGHAYPLRAAMAHAHLLGVHPLEDGNGRLARLLVPLMGLADGMPPVFVARTLKARWPAYLAALTGLDRQGDWTGFLRFFLGVLSQAAWETLRLGEALAALPDAWSGALSGARGHASSRRLAAVLPFAPVLTVPGAKARLDVSFPAANQALLDLEKRGLVREVSGQRRGRVYAAQTVLDLLDGQAG